MARAKLEAKLTVLPYDRMTLSAGSAGVVEQVPELGVEVASPSNDRRVEPIVIISSEDARFAITRMHGRMAALRELIYSVGYFDEAVDEFELLRSLDAPSFVQEYLVDPNRLALRAAAERAVVGLNVEELHRALLDAPNEEAMLNARRAALEGLADEHRPDRKFFDELAAGDELHDVLIRTVREQFEFHFRRCNPRGFARVRPNDTILIEDRGGPGRARILLEPLSDQDAVECIHAIREYWANVEEKRLYNQADMEFIGRLVGRSFVGDLYDTIKYRNIPLIAPLLTEAVERMEALARRRSNWITALDAVAAQIPSSLREVAPADQFDQIRRQDKERFEWALNGMPLTEEDAREIVEKAMQYRHGGVGYSTYVTRGLLRSHVLTDGVQMDQVVVGPVHFPALGEAALSQGLLYPAVDADGFEAPLRRADALARFSLEIAAVGLDSPLANVSLGETLRLMRLQFLHERRPLIEDLILTYSSLKDRHLSMARAYCAGKIYAPQRAQVSTVQVAADAAVAADDKILELSKFSPARFRVNADPSVSALLLLNPGMPIKWRATSSAIAALSEGQRENAVRFEQPETIKNVLRHLFALTAEKLSAEALTVTLVAAPGTGECIAELQIPDVAILVSREALVAAVDQPLELDAILGEIGIPVDGAGMIHIARPFEPGMQFDAHLEACWDDVSMSDEWAAFAARGVA